MTIANDTSVRRLGAVLMILGAVAVAAGLLALVTPGLREVGFALVAGVVSPRGALLAGAALIAVGVLLRRRAPGPPGR